MPDPYQPKTLTDSLSSFEAGMNSGVNALLLPKNQAANLVNTTVRGTFMNQRPSYKKIALTFLDTGIQTNFETGLWQKACFYKPDNQAETLIASISGKLYQIKLSTTASTATVQLVSAVGLELNPDAPICWLWQSEKWLIGQDGLNNPLFFDGTICTRSNYSVPVQFSTTVAASAIVPAIGSTVSVTMTSGTNIAVGDILTIKGVGQWLVQDISGSPVIVLVNISATSIGYAMKPTNAVTWAHLGTQLPPGRMGAYGMGRNWTCLVDGKQFVAGDQVGGSSGTPAYNFRDAVLNVTENLYLAGGGFFTVPGSIGDIKAMRFAAVLNAAMGQGPLQVSTPFGTFSCNTPVDRLTWQDVTNPILTESLIANGALGQESTINANSDIWFRSVDGIRSLILAIRQFGQDEGNTPQSREVDKILSQDNPSLLEYGSAVNFGNRILMTVNPIQGVQGVYHKGLIALNLDPVSSLRGKAPPAYDGLWTGINTFQILTQSVVSNPRCFAFTFNEFDGKIELYEVLKDGQEFFDDTDIRITRTFESPVIFKNDIPANALSAGGTNPRHELLQLHDGEIAIDKLRGTADFTVYWKPEFFPCWSKWCSFSECNTQPDSPDPNTQARKPGFRPAIGFGQCPGPKLNGDFCDTTNNRPLNQGFFFQIKIVITGSVEVVGLRFSAKTVPERPFAMQSCTPICSTD